MKPPEERRLSEYEMLREALNNLSAIANSESPGELVIGEDDRLVMPGSDEYAQIQSFSHKQDSSKKVEVMKSTFRYILEYIRRIYHKEKGNVHNKAILQGIQTIMVLVGEAANKLDRYTSLFKRVHGQSITQLKEFQDLQDFYINKIFKPSQERLALAEIPTSIIAAAHIPDTFEGDEESIITKSLSDLETVREDADYELFYLAREDGTRFFTEELIRDMQAACESGLHHSEQYVGDDPFLQVKNWEDKQLQVLAQQCLDAIKGPLGAFYQEALRHQDIEIVATLHRALMALMLGSSPRNMLRHFAVKSCYQYFQDFQGFLRATMRSQEYYKLLDRPVRKSQGFLKATIEMVHSLCMTLYMHVPPRGEIIKGIDNLVERGSEQLKREDTPLAKASNICDEIENSYKAIERVLRNYPNGPILKALDLLIDQSDRVFDSLEIGNLPYVLFDVFMGDRSFTLLNVPSPTIQKQIHKAMIADEFKGYLRALGERGKQHLMINVQDRTSWKEHARCLALEELARQAEFNEQLTEVTFAKDTDFYYQLAPYHNLDDAANFIAQFKEHLNSSQTGFSFPPRVFEKLSSEAMEELLKAVHRFFFKEEEQLSRRQRLDFIEIAYTLLQLKIIDVTEANCVSYTSKDNIDRGAADGVQLYIFLKLLSGQEVTEIDLLKEMLFAPALMLRERMIEQERVLRMLNMVRHVQAALDSYSKSNLKKALMQELTPLFSFPILEASLTISQHETP